MRHLTVILWATALSGCVSDAARMEYSRPQAIPHYDVPPQVIYRIDDHRFVTLENYSDCHHGDTFYNDTKQDIRKKLGRSGIENFQGRLINADPTGRNIVIPSSQPPERACSDRGCTISLLYSTDGGKNFFGTRYMRSYEPFKDSAKYTIVVTRDKLFIVEAIGNDAYVLEKPLLPEIDLDRPYPPGVKGSSFRASSKPGFLSDLRSPSGQERLSCDPSIQSTNPVAPLTK